MTYWDSHDIRKLCLKHDIRFYVTKDRHLNYSVRLYAHDASDVWEIEDYDMARIIVKFIAKAQAPFMDFHLN